ncbi:penicillin acylase family protein [Streptomyces sp. NPDC055013]
MTLGGTMRTRPRRFVVAAVALLATVAGLPAAAADRQEQQDRHNRHEQLSHGGMSAVIRYTEYGIPHIVAKDYRSMGFGTGWAQAADQVCTLAGIALDSRLGEHQFVVRNGQRIPVPGGTEGLGVWNKIEPVWNAAQGGYTEVTTGSSHIQAVGWDAGRCPVARTLLTYAQSSNPNSAHFRDQTRLFSGERWVTARFCEKDILSSPVLKVVRVRER